MVVNSLRRRRANDDRGAAVVEFALILPILVLLVFGIVQFSLAYNRQQGLNAAAREGARLGAIETTTKSQIETRVTASLDGVKFAQAPTIAVSPNTTNPCMNRAGQTVVVTVQGKTDLDIPLWGKDSITLTGKGTFRCE